MPKLVLETKQEENGEERRVGARVWILYVAYLHGDDPRAVNRVVLTNSACGSNEFELESPQPKHDPLRKRIKKPNTNPIRLFNGSYNTTH